MRILLLIFAVFLTLCAGAAAGFSWLGQRASREFLFSEAIKIEASPEVVWAALTKVSTFVQRYEDIQEVELLEVDDFGPLRWKIQRGKTSVMVYRRSEASPPHFLRIAIDGGNMGIEGEYRYHLVEDNGKTVLTAQEETSVGNIVLRAAFTLSGGRGQVVRRQLAEIKQISEEQ